MIVVAIDGPSGVGKSTVGKALAASLGIPYLDTGAMYRAIGLLARRNGVPLPIADPDRVGKLSETAEVRVTGTGGNVRTLLDGEDVSEEIRQPEVSLYASAVAAIPQVRRRLAAQQRELALAGGGVLEGRDIGTKVIPEATAKFFLTARPEIRARRRFEELIRKGTPQDLASVQTEMEARDQADSTRADSPLACDETYQVVDTSDLGPEQVAEQLRGWIVARLSVDLQRPDV
ncbi:MAG: (d)CMP kinase [Holophagales bacterium]|jgi:cytidylate kinase|nr:(d)CMP kinase [Holophagales bacterium]MBK9967824.1 (d)CMP kinase [Holophagales bacterium]